MKLIIDYGNSFVKLALFQEDSIISIKSFNSKATKEVIEFLQEIKKNNDSPQNLINVIISSVIDFPEDVKSYLNQEFSLLELNISTPIPITLNYKTPDTLGKDRIALAVAGAKLYPHKNVLIIDAGTCITYDFIDKDKEYQGGSISPGIKMRFNALNTFTDKLPLINPTDKVELIGKSTEESISSGVMRGVYSEIDGIIDRYKINFPDIEVILTGGDIIYFDKKLKNNIFANSNLVLKGLNMILDYNAGK